LAQSRGNYDCAEQEFLAAITAAKGQLDNANDDDAHNAWEGYFYLIDLFLKYDLPDKALKYYREAELYAGGRKGFLENNERVGHSLIRLAETQIRQNQSREARETLMRAEQALQSVDSPRWLVGHLSMAASLHQQMKDYEKARNRIKDALGICKRHRLISEQIPLLLQQAEFSLQAPSIIGERAYPVDELTHVVDNLRSNGEKPQFIQALALLVDAAFKAGLADVAQQHANSLLQATEALSQQYAREERLIFFQHSVYESIKSAIRLDILLGHIDSAFVKLSYVKARALRGRMAGNTAPGLDLLKAQRWLQPTEALIDYMVTSDTLYAFVLTTTALQLVRIPASKHQLQADTDAYVKHLSDQELFHRKKGKADLEKTFLESVRLSNRLYRSLFAQVVPLMQNIERLYVVPDECLYAVPFGTLASRARVDARFLIEDMAMMVLPGAWMLTEEAVPHLEGREPVMLASIDSKMRGADTIENYLRTKLDRRADIQTEWEDKNAFERRLEKNYRQYLFYAHAAADWGEPRQSWIEFPLDSTSGSGRLTYNEIDSLDWRQTSLVILAGCETTGSRIYLGAGLAGLQQAFIAAGANQVLATYWKVDAMQVADQIPVFLDIWKLDQDALHALQVMQRRAIEQLRQDPFYKYPHPQLWGAYNLTGHKPFHVQQLSWTKY
jgi:CHAT domain-containing protein